MARLVQTFEITPPVGFVLVAQFVEYRPGIEPRVVPVIEDQPHGITSNGFDSLDVHSVLVGHEHAFAGSVPLDLRRRRVDSQVLGRELETRAVRECDLQSPRTLSQLQLRWERRGIRHAHLHSENVSRQVFVLNELTQMFVDAHDPCATFGN